MSLGCGASRAFKPSETPLVGADFQHRLLMTVECQVFNQFRQRQRLADQKALHLVATKAAQQVQLLPGFHTFGHHLQVEVVGQVDHGVHQLAVLFTLLHAANEALVDLEQGDRQAVEVHERGEPGAEVVQGETHPQATQGIHGLLDQLAAAHDGGFSEFEFQPLCLDTPLGNQPAQGRQQLAVLELPERQVDRHVQRRQPPLAQGLHVPQRPGNHPVPQRHDQATLFGQRHELTRWQQSAFAMTPAHQRFEADNVAAIEAQPWLVMQLQLVTAQGPAQFAFQVGEAAGVAVDALVEDMKGTALGALGLLHGDVGVPHQRIGAGLGASVGNAQAAADQQAFTVHPIGLGQGFGNPLGHPLGPLWRAAGIDQQGEFITAQARQLIAGFQGALESRHHLQDQAVTGLVAEGIVGVTKVVQVQVTEGQATAVVFRQACRQQRLETLAIGNARQRVLFGKALQGVFQHATFAHMAQATTQGRGVEGITHQPVTDAVGGQRRLVLKQQDSGQAATARRRLQRRNGQQHRVAIIFEQAAD